MKRSGVMSEGVRLDEVTAVAIRTIATAARRGGCRGDRLDALDDLAIRAR